MLRLYRILGDNKIMIAVMARMLDLKRPDTLKRKLKGQSPFTSFEKLRVESILKQAGIVTTPKAAAQLWASEPDFVHPFFEKEALVMGPSSRSCVERLEGFNVAHPPSGVNRLIDFRKEVVPMANKIDPEVLERFGLDRDPFLNEMLSRDDVYMSRAHARAERTILDAATYQYFVALVADVGSGKTTVLKKVLERLAKDSSFHVSRLRCVEKEESNAYGIIEALIRDFSSDTPRRSREARARQIGAILEQMVREKQKPVLIIDDAHALGYRVLRALKRLYDETECGFRRSIAIILAGQRGNFDKSQNLEDKLGNFDLREVSERCQLVRLSGLGGELGDYIAWKFARAGARHDGKDVVAADAVKLLARTYDTPLAVNNVVGVAMTLAHDVGKREITAELMADAIKAAQSGHGE